MNKIILTSYLDFDDKDINEVRIPKHFGNKNNILDNLKKYIKKYDNFLYIASDRYDTSTTDLYANVAIESFKMTLPFKNYDILDNRTIDNIDELISSADFIFLSGGHVPTQNKFFNEINLKGKLNNTNALICGGSAGSMNASSIVYAAPELEGESIDDNFIKEYDGLGLTDINIIPHYNDLVETILDNKKYIEEILLPDSYKYKIYAIVDGSYFVIDNNITTLYGEGYIIENGIITKINEDNEIITIE